MSKSATGENKFNITTDGIQHILDRKKSATTDLEIKMFKNDTDITMDDIQCVLDSMKTSTNNLTINELQEALNQFDDEENFVISFGLHLNGNFGSYGGLYEDLYLESTDIERGINTVGQLKELLSRALKTGIMQGFNGKDYVINGDTLLWLAQYGFTGYSVTGIQKRNNTITLLVGRDYV